VTDDFTSVFPPGRLLREFQLSTLTRAVQLLKERGISFEVAEYEHVEKGALFASKAIGMPGEQTIKTLVVEFATNEYFVVLMPGSKTVHFKKLAKTRKKAGMVDPATAERLTGYPVGGISPFGMKQRLRVMIDAGLLSFDKVAINGGRRGLMLVMSPADILKVTEAEPIEL
jgi:Cys-tRNA(Pro)/Cys-tRNA(Cys) deacylase